MNKISKETISQLKLVNFFLQLNNINDINLIKSILSMKKDNFFIFIVMSNPYNYIGYLSFKFIKLIKLNISNSEILKELFTREMEFFFKDLPKLKKILKYEIFVINLILEKLIINPSAVISLDLIKNIKKSVYIEEKEIKSYFNFNPMIEIKNNEKLELKSLLLSLKNNDYKLTENYIQCIKNKFKEELTFFTINF